GRYPDGESRIVRFIGSVSPAASNWLPSSSDRDSDGLPDVWEALFGTDLDNPADANLDQDGDGMTNLAEFRAGTDPNDPVSNLRVGIFFLSPEEILLRFRAMPQQSYALYYSESLTGSPSQKLADFPARSGEHVEEIHDQINAGGGSRYYRVSTLRQ